MHFFFGGMSRLHESAARSIFCNKVSKENLMNAPFCYNPIPFVNFRIASNLGRALGVAFGCLIGMFPLLFLETGEVEEDDKCDDDKE